MRRRSASPPAGAAPAPLLLAGVATGTEPTILVERVSKWCHDIVAVSDVSFGIAPGVTALLGPNGAGKSTILKMMAGLLRPSSGAIRIHGRSIQGAVDLYRRFGLVHESETVYPFLTGREFVRFNATLQKLKNADQATTDALATVEMTAVAARRVGRWSTGLRQRIKLAGALVHDPDVVLMDEPLSGMDPAQRAQMIDLIRSLGRTKTILVSSHVLAEVERFADDIIVIVNGRLAAAGDYRVIRDKIDGHDHTVRIRSDHPRRLAVTLIGHPATRSIKVESGSRLLAETSDARGFYKALPGLARQANVRLLEVQAGDESLQSVFAYLVER
jgi:ABC-2 type transport system ATP-binding protein